MNGIKKLSYMTALSLASLMECGEKEKPYYLEKNVSEYNSYDIAIEKGDLAIGNLHNDSEGGLEFDDYILTRFDENDSSIIKIQIRARTHEEKSKLEKFVDAQKLKKIYAEMKCKKIGMRTIFFQNIQK